MVVKIPGNTINNKSCQNKGHGFIFFLQYAIYQVERNKYERSHYGQRIRRIE